MHRKKVSNVISDNGVARGGGRRRGPRRGRRRGSSSRCGISKEIHCYQLKVASDVARSRNDNERIERCRTTVYRGRHWLNNQVLLFPGGKGVQNPLANPDDGPVSANPNGTRRILSTERILQLKSIQVLLNRFELKDPPYCACAPEKVQDILHVLEECPIFARERAETEAGIGVIVARQGFPGLLKTRKIENCFEVLRAGHATM
ncbi:hypothetical protein EVAR_12097_1 [Eumeta japonica]|uniref:Uncharacterized protein n=1 Tax=Eumeta variegata TaxID=151549 RepID=A0A4C1U6N7_EUMVA|nr:hypothetical protein EVAR_12097_1 [Eumeta japonica]